MRNKLLTAVARAAGFVKGVLSKRPEIGGIPIGRYIFVGPMVPTTKEQQQKGMCPWMVFPVEMRHRERNKYAPKPPAFGARQLARARLHGFAGRHPEIIRREIEIARHDLEWLK